MSIDRLERINALLRRELAEAFFKVFVSDGLDLAAVTVTRVEASRNLRHAAVYVSILGHEHERGSILRRLARRHTELQALVNRDCHLKYTPRLEFHLDASIAKGDHMLDVLAHLEAPEDGEQRSEVGGQTPEVRDQKSEIRSQEP